VPSGSALRTIGRYRFPSVVPETFFAKSMMANVFAPSYASLAVGMGKAAAYRAIFEIRTESMAPGMAGYWMGP
jgi:hypothetical protein